MLPTDLETKLHINNLNFYYGDFHALKNINMRIAKNKVTAFIGPSGCGKSTLLRTLNRMFELYPNQRATGKSILMERIYSPPIRIFRLFEPKSVWFSKTDPIPDVHLR